MDKLMNPFRWLAYIFYIFARKYHLKNSRSVYFFAIQESIMLLILSSMEIIMLLFKQHLVLGISLMFIVIFANIYFAYLPGRFIKACKYGIRHHLYDSTKYIFWLYLLGMLVLYMYLRLGL